MEGDSEEFAEMSDLYRYFRINRLRVKGIWHGASTTPEVFGLYFEPNGATGAPLTVDQLEGKFCIGTTYGTGFKGDAAEMSLAREELHTITPWFVTLNDTSAGADADGPGSIDLLAESGTTTDGILMIEIEMSITFRSRLDPQSISAKLRARIEQSEGISKIEKLNSKPEMQQAPRVKVLPKREARL